MVKACILKSNIHTISLNINPNFDKPFTYISPHHTYNLTMDMTGLTAAPSPHLNPMANSAYANSMPHSDAHRPPSFLVVPMRYRSMSSPNGKETAIMPPSGSSMSPSERVIDSP